MAFSGACRGQSAGCIGKAGWPVGSFRLTEGPDAPAPQAGRGPNRGRHPGPSQGLYTTGRTPCGDKPERTTPSRSPFGARMQWPEPAYTEQSLARLRAPDEGRCRADPHCTRDGGGRHRRLPALFLTFSTVPRSFGAVDPPRGDQPTPGGEDRLQADVVRPGPERRQAGDVLQRRRRAPGGVVPQGRRLPHRGRLLQGGRAAEQQQAAAAAARQRPRPGRRTAARPRPRRPAPAPAPAAPAAGRRMPPAPTRPTGPASASTSPATTTPRATAARTSSSSGRGRR